MKPRAFHHTCHAGLCVPALIILCTASVDAAPSTWTGATDGDFLTGANWSAGVPGATSPTINNSDIATFNNNVNTAVTLTAGRNLKGITFDGNQAGLGAFSLGGSGTLTFSAAGTIAVTGMHGNSNQSIANNLAVAGNSNSNDLLISTSPTYTGTLGFGGAITSAGSSSNTQVNILGGAGTSLNFTGNISNGGSSTLTLQLSAANRSTVTLSGTNTFGAATSNIIVLGGRLIADYSSGNVPLAIGRTPNIGSGILEIKGASSGSTTATVNSLTTVAYSASTVVVNPNGGSGTTLALGGTLIARGTGSATLFDLSASNSAITYTQATNNSFGLLKSSVDAATFFVKDSTGIGFATKNASNFVVRNTTYSGTLPSAVTAGSANYYRTAAGTLTATGNIEIGTVDVNTTAGAITIDMGTFSLRQPSGGKPAFSLLVNGSYDFELKASTGGVGLAATSSMIFAHYGTGTATLSARSLGNGILRSGTGLVVINNSSASANLGNQTLLSGITRYMNALSLPLASGTGAGTIYLTGGTLEIGEDLNGGTAGDFSRSLGTAVGNIAMDGHVGFSAYGADRVVNIGGAGVALTWGSTSTNMFTGTLTLGSTVSTHTLELQNPINLNNRDRNIHAENGSAAVDGKLSGVISGTGVGIQKTGAGTLELTAANTYSGNTTISGGTLKLSNSGTLASSSVITVGDTGSSGTVLDLTAKSAFTIGASQTLCGIGTVDIGAGDTLTIDGTHSAGGTLNAVGTQTIAGDLAYGGTSIFSWDLNTASNQYDQVSLSGSLTIDAAAKFRINSSTDFSTAFWNNNHSWSDIFGANSISNFDVANFQYQVAGSNVTTPSPLTEGVFSISSNTLTWTAVPEPGTALAGLLLGAGLLRRRRGL